MEQAYFELDGDTFVGGDQARGPWSKDHCHAGPVTGLIARAVEGIVGPEKMLTRLTVDLIAPLPLAGLNIFAEVQRNGRSLATAIAKVTDRDGRLCANATSTHILERDIGPVATAPVPRHEQARAEASVFPVREVAHNNPYFADFIEVALPPGETKAPGPTTLWMKTPPLVSGEIPTSFQNLCPMADCGNGISRNEELNNVGFMNTDITIVRHRVSHARWLASTARSEWHSTGIGLTTAVLQDEAGPIATVLQTLMLNRISV